MHERNRDVCPRWSKYVPDTTFKYFVSGYNSSISQSRQREIIEGFSYMALLGKIDMKNPEITFGCFEERALSSHFELFRIAVFDCTHR
jgi:tRNA (guanine10-N2)-methyltransferase